MESSPKSEHQKDFAFVKEVGDEFEEWKTVKSSIRESKKKIMFDEWRRKLREGWKPSYIFPVFVILILVLLMFSGRSFAILCTSLEA
ncbi:hypothetical protein L1887_44275 [Cichorium endivia]|nr:hypothetical protein L1887_44275 [Cichorium endivia]